VILAAPDELALGLLSQDAARAGLRAIEVHEPDLGGALTAIALEPAGHRVVRALPLAFPSALPSAPRASRSPSQALRARIESPDAA
jgi:hypothetical protein